MNIEIHKSDRVSFCIHMDEYRMYGLPGTGGVVISKWNEDNLTPFTPREQYFVEAFIRTVYGDVDVLVRDGCQW